MSIPVDSSPKISVLMSVYNGEQFLREAIDSILQQTYRDFEFIIVNDGSQDRSEEIIRSYEDPRIRFYSNGQNLGLIPSLNRGLQMAQGEFLARLDADDVALPQRLEKQVQVLESSPEIVLTGTQMQLIDSDGKDLEVWAYPEHPLLARWVMMFNTPVSNSSVLARAQPMREVGGYRIEYKYAEDFDLWSRLAEHGDVVNLPEVLGKYRVHGESVTTTREQEQNELRFRITRPHLEKHLSHHPDEVLRRLGDSSLRLTCPQMKQALQAYQDLFTSFVTEHQPNAQIQAQIRSDLIARIGPQFQALGYGSRLRSMLSQRELFGGRFWWTGRFLWYSMSDRNKRALKSLLGLRHRGIDRSEQN